MTVPVWPPTVNDVPLVDSWACDDPYQDNLGTDMDGGNKRARTRPGDGLMTIKFSIMMNAAQFQTFKDWILTDLNRGTLRFTGRYWDGSQMVSGATLQLADKPKYSTQYPKTMAQLALWVYPQ